MISDSEITKGIKQGDKESFAALFKSYYSPLTRYAATVTKDFDTAEEIVQEFFGSLWQNRQNINIYSSVKGYLYRSVHNRCLHYLSHQKVIEKYAKGRLASSSAVSEEPVAEAIYYSELEAVVEKVLAALPERSARVFKMNRFEGKRYGDIARELAISIKTVEVDMGKALRAFRDALGDYNR
jgi:RNA polymerase sigma-70 factor (ECF subfamily)